MADTHSTMTPEEQAQARARISMASPEHLKMWLEATHRKWIVLNAVDLVGSLPWPEGVDDFARVVACYREYRRGIPTGDTEKVDTPDGGTAEVPTYKGETLELVELDRCIRWLIGLASEKDPTWRLDNSPL